MLGRVTSHLLGRGADAHAGQLLDLLLEVQERLKLLIQVVLIREDEDWTGPPGDSFL
jgi:hypothetical protein